MTTCTYSEGKATTPMELQPACSPRCACTTRRLILTCRGRGIAKDSSAIGPGGRISACGCTCRCTGPLCAEGTTACALCTYGPLFHIKNGTQCSAAQETLNKFSGGGKLFNLTDCNGVVNTHAVPALATVEVMSTVMSSTYVAPLHRWGLAVTVLNDEIVAAGGCCDVLALAFNQVETFSPVRGKVIAGKWKIGQFRRTTARVTFQAPRAQFAVWRCSGGRSRRCGVHSWR